MRTRFTATFETDGFTFTNWHIEPAPADQDAGNKVELMLAADYDALKDASQELARALSERLGVTLDECVDGPFAKWRAALSKVEA